MLTIISVSYKSKDFLEKNYELVKMLNPDTPFKWIVVQNTPDDALDEDLAMDDPRFKMIKGPLLTQQERESSFYRSIHHAKALNLALAYTEAGFILILDPDCFILVPNWINTVSTYVQQHRLVFFGVPYHPKYYTHYRGFPNAICMFIHRQLMQELNFFSLDFSPDFERKRLLNNLQQKAVEYHSSLKTVFKFFSSSTRVFPLQLRDFHLITNWMIKQKLYKHFSLSTQQEIDRYIDRFRLPSCHDTGYKIYAQYHSLLKHQVMQIFTLDKRSRLGKFFESILPNRFRLYPRQDSYMRDAPSPLFSDIGEFGEQFFWKDELFAFHLKGVLDNVSNEEKARMKELTLKKIQEHLELIQRNG